MEEKLRMFLDNFPWCYVEIPGYALPMFISCLWVQGRCGRSPSLSRALKDCTQLTKLTFLWNVRIIGTWWGIVGAPVVTAVETMLLWKCTMFRDSNRFSRNISNIAMFVTNNTHLLYFLLNLTDDLWQFVQNLWIIVKCWASIDSLCRRMNNKEGAMMRNCLCPTTKTWVLRRHSRYHILYNI